MADIWAEFDQRAAKPKAAGEDLWAEFDAPQPAPELGALAPEPRAAVPNAPVAVAEPAAPPLAAAPASRTLGDLVNDAALTLRSGARNVAGGAVGAPVNIANAIMDPLPARLIRSGMEWATGADIPAPLEALGAPEAIGQPDAVRGIRESLAITGQEDAAEYRSPVLGEQQAGFDEVDGFMPTLAYLAQNPSFAAMLGLEQVPQVALAAVPGSPLLTIGAQGVSAGSQVEGQIAAELADKVAKGELTQERADQIGADAFRGSASINTALPFLPGAGVLERAAALRPRAGAGGIVAGAVRGAAGEGTQGVLSEGSDQIIENVSTGRPATENLGKATALGALLEGGLGAIAGGAEGGIRGAGGPGPELGTPPAAEPAPAPRAPEPAPAAEPGPEINEETLVRNILGDDVAAELGLEEATVAEALTELGAEAPPNAAVPAAPDSVPAVAADAPVGTVAPAERAPEPVVEPLRVASEPVPAPIPEPLPPELPQTTAPAVQSSAAPTAPVPAEGALAEPAAVTAEPATVEASLDTPLPDILAQPRAAVLKQRIKAAGIKKGSPGYADAVAGIEAQLEADTDAALAETTFEQYRDLNPGVPEGVARQAWESLQAGPLQSTEAAELLTDDLTPAERASLDRQSIDRRSVRQRLSEQQGAADADALGLREAVTKAIPGAKVQVQFVRDLDGLPADIARPAQSRMDARGGTRTAGLYVPGPEPRVYVLTSVARTPEAAAFTAAHEIAGHDGLRKLAGDGLSSALEIALQNPTVAAVASSMAQQRRMGPEARLLAAEEALADLAGAARTGNWSRLEAKHGVKVPLGMRSRVAAAVENFIRRLVALFKKQGMGFSDAQVRDLLENAWQAARGEGAATAGDALDAAEAVPTPLESVETDFDVREADKLAPPDLGLIERSKRDVAERVEAFRKLGKGRPKNPRTLLQRANALRSALFDSVVSRARALERRNPNAKSLRKLFNQVVTAPGESRLVGETMNEQIERTFAQFTNRVRNILAKEGFERLTPAQNDQLRAALLGTDKNPAPPIKRAADRLRKLMDVARDDLIAAGVEIGEVEDIGYLTRLYDDAKILDDEAGFLETAGRYYETEGFANDVGKDARGILYEPGRLAAFIGHAKRVGSPTVTKGLDALKAEVRKYRSGGALTEVKAVERIVAELYPAVAKDYGERSASAWLHKIKTPAVSQVFNGVGPSGSPVTKSRALTGAADTILAPYMNTDVLDILDTYARTTTKKAAMAQRFGPKGEKVQELIDAASREGVPARDLQEATELMESALGSFNPINPDIKAGMDALQAWAYLALLSRVTFSSAAEAMTFAIRTGDIRNAAAPLVQVYRAVTRSQRGKELNDMALLIGLNGNKAMEEVMQNQLGGDYAMEPKWSKLVHNFMQATLLTPLTRAQRAYGVGAATGYLRWLSKNMMAGKRRSEMAALLNELGIADHEAFATWMTAQGALPSEADLFDADGRPTPRGLDYMTAVRRMTDQTIQNPNASHRPSWMNNPAGRLAGSIMGFSYAAYENIIKREIALNKTLRTEAPRGTAERRLGAALTGLAALAIGQTLVSTVREMLFNAARFEDKDDDEIAKEMAMLGISRTLGLGSADPLIQYITGLKYRRSAAETMAGAAVGSFAELIDSVVGLATDANSPSTDTAEYRAMEQVYSKIITPVANAALSFLPNYLSAPAILGVSDKRMREKFAGMFFDAPERETELDRDYRAAVRDLEDVEDAVKARIGIAPKDQWEAELEAIKSEYPVILDGVTIEKYKVKTERGAAGTPKVTSDGGPVLGLERSDVDGAGTLLGETEGYRQYDKRTRKYEMTPGTEDRIRALNKTIKALRDGEDLTLGNVADLTAELAYETDAMPTLMAATAEVSRAPGGSFDGAGAKPAGRSTIRDVREELEAIRRAEKRAVLEMTRRAERGEAIPRGFAERYVADAMRKPAP